MSDILFGFNVQLGSTCLLPVCTSSDEKSSRTTVGCRRDRDNDWHYSKPHKYSEWSVVGNVPNVCYMCDN